MTSQNVEVTNAKGSFPNIAVNNFSKIDVHHNWILVLIDLITRGIHCEYNQIHNRCRLSESIF